MRSRQGLLRSQQCRNAGIRADGRQTHQWQAELAGLRPGKLVGVLATGQPGRQIHARVTLMSAAMGLAGIIGQITIQHQVIGDQDRLVLVGGT